ncbi:DddA-like double-stranded DNA deaminase toxin [Actinosynnema sp. CA-299493]
MASIEEVAKCVSQACDQASKSRDALGQAEDLVEEAHDLLAANLRGAVDLESDTERTLARFTEVKDGITDLWKILGMGMDRAQAALTTLTGENAAPPPPDAPRPAQPPRRPPERQSSTPPQVRPVEPSAPPVIPPEKVEELRRELPPDVPPADQRPPGTPRPKTHGRWIGPDGQTRPVVSGEDEMYRESETALAALGLRRKLTRASDVEMKMAAYMRNHGVRSATLLINNTPCRGPLGCDELVPVLLPEGATLTVHGANGFTKTYAGGATPPWRKS